MGYESGIPIEVGVTPTGYVAQGDSLDIWERGPERGIHKNMDNAMKKTMGHIGEQMFRHLQKQWRTTTRWVIGTDGGLKGTLGTGGISFHIREESEKRGRYVV